MKFVFTLAQRRFARAQRKLRLSQPRITSAEAQRQFDRVMRLSVSLIVLSLAACTTPQPPPGGYSKEEQAAIRQENRERRALVRHAANTALRIADGYAK